MKYGDVPTFHLFIFGGVAINQFALMQDAPFDYDSVALRDTCSISNRQTGGFELGGQLLDCDHLCGGLLLLLHDGLWSYSKYPVLWDIPHKGAQSLHHNMCISLLDRRHHRDRYAACVARFDRLSRHLWHLCCRVRHIMGVRLFESSRNQRHASWSHHRVLLRWNDANSYCKKLVIRSNQPLVCMYCSFRFWRSPPQRN